ncbi:cell wall anchor protein [Micromonospora sp. NBC_01699]|uniref:cell wall anchor protein n=1 Tax=Micromonospora sp. NBC_01699 TaxID=2975984 RepID=UPI002E33325A|nr:cell wall anchor protein [Micromonospora sp. NBC_01699]
MIRPKLSLRRPLAVLGATFVGLAAAVAVAAPASAHISVPSGSAVCDTDAGEWVVTWKVESTLHFDSDKFKLHYIRTTPRDIPIDGIVRNKDYPVDTPIVGTQRVPGTTVKAELDVKATWSDGFREQDLREGNVTLEGTCEKKSPEATPSATPSATPTETPATPPAKVSSPNASTSSACDGTVQVTLSNGEDATADAVLRVRATGFDKTYTLAPGASKDDIVVPAEAGEIKITEGEQQVGSTVTWAEPENCVEPGEPVGGYESTCDELIFMISNPEDGEPVTLTLTPSTGEPKTLTVAPGTTETAKFPASEGLTVTPSADGLEDAEPIAWEKPADCGGEGGGLPVTGAAAGGIAGGALVLLAIGITLFVVARRRRLTFTA